LNLTRIEIAGFKSFEHRLGVDFSGGITAVIGPNGCGKTNIVDAIRWVLGEQKTRLLRNTKMENVIFNGTKTRQPLGMAEVHLTLSNDDHSLPLDYSEVTISRRLYRDGASEYCINGEVARLKDIRGLLVDTGLGNHTYSIIEREMVDSVISEKDQDKRYLLEEAAGVMRYRLQREEALRKIEHTEGDLTRLNDILVELDKEIRSLRYQMGKARRYSRLRGKLEFMETALVKRSLFELLNQIDEIQKEKTHHEGITLADDNEITVREDRLAEMRIGGSELETRLQDLYENRHNLSQSLKQHEERIAILNERTTANDNRIREDGEEIERAREKLPSLGDELAEYRRVIEGREDELRKCRDDLSQKEERLGRVARDFEAVKNEIRDRKQLVLDFVKETERTRELRKHLEGRLVEIGERKRRSEDELASITESESALRAKLEESAGVADEKRSRIALVNRSLETTAAKIERLATLVAKREEMISRETIELNRLREKTELLKRIKNEHAERQHELFSEKGRIQGVLADRVKVEKKYRRCFEACLSPVLQALLTESKQEALKCVEGIRGSVSGKVQLLYPNGDGATSQGDCDDPGIGTARDLLGESDGVLDYLGPYLSGIVVTKDVDGALTLLEKSPGRRVATLDGVFFDGPGRIVVAGADDVALTLLEFDSKLSELGASAGRCEERLSRLRDRKERLERGRAVLVERMTALRARLHVQEEEHARLVETRQQREVELAVAREKLASLATALVECDTESESIRSRLEMAPEPAADVHEAGAGTLDLSELDKRAVNIEREKDSLGEAAARIRLAVAHMTGEVTTAQEKRKHAEMLEAELRDLIVYREEDARRCADEIETARTEIAEARGRIKGCHADVEKIEREIDEAKSSHEDLKLSSDQLEKELKELKEQREHKRENVQRCALEIATRETRVKDLIEKARESFDQDIEAYIRDRSLFNPTEWEKLDAGLLGELRRTVEAFGPVNMLALDEFNQRKERFDFLSKQKADLEEAKESLNQAIRRINKEARRRISETFDQVRANFKTTFVTLFDGGEADLLFEDSDDPLEAKIKLVANPKGKRLQDISSLSGGERALVALSLLFAIYLVKPSPFCVFDEVDAPLDDANVTRFVRLLKSFTDRTRFIVITHNKKTMEAADCLYGVTMEEPGVSKMISVHIGDVDRFRERRAPREKAAEPAEEVSLQP